MDYCQEMLPATVLHWNYRGLTEFPLQRLDGEELEVTDIYLKENLISRVPKEICKLENLESLYLSGNDITDLPKEISQLRCLKCLDISGNRLRRVPDEIGEMRNLKFLILDENELTELPLRLSELRALRYLSVCDNKLQWLPQRPVYNYHHCEFRFWRNINLKTIPYALWYHMFRNQQTRSLNIGCLTYPTISTNSTKIRLKFTQDSIELCIDIHTPTQHENILENRRPPSLSELSKRLLYQMISDAAKRQSQEVLSFSWKSYNDEHLKNLQETLNECNLNSTNFDINGNSSLKPHYNAKSYNYRSYCVPKDLIVKYFTDLPHFIRTELCNGPLSTCDNVECRKPIFDYVFYEFCFGTLILIDNTAEVLLSATFCSQTCANAWRNGKNVIPWSIIS